MQIDLITVRVLLVRSPLLFAHKSICSWQFQREQDCMQWNFKFTAATTHARVRQSNSLPIERDNCAQAVTNSGLTLCTCHCTDRVLSACGCGWCCVCTADTANCSHLLWLIALADLAYPHSGKDITLAHSSPGNIEQIGFTLAKTSPHSTPVLHLVTGHVRCASPLVHSIEVML